jgi:hypothetical protein
MSKKEEEETWLDKMQGYLKWKVNGPQLNNPYAPRISDTQLKRMIGNPNYLRENLELRCTCDGYEVLLLKNLEKPRVRCDHPCLNVLSRRQIVEAIGRHGIQEFLDTQIAKVHKELVEEIERRKKDKSPRPEKQDRTLKEIRAAKEAANQAVASVQTSADDEGDDGQRFRSLLS